MKIWVGGVEVEEAKEILGCLIIQGLGHKSTGTTSVQETALPEWRVQIGLHSVIIVVDISFAKKGPVTQAFRVSLNSPIEVQSSWGEGLLKQN